MSSFVWVGLGSALGGMGRFWISSILDQRYGEALRFFPIGTLTANVSGCFLIGLIAAFAEPDSRWLLNPQGRQFLMLGLLGGYTTFSSFSLQTLHLARDGEWLLAGLNLLLSTLLCLVGVWLGSTCGQWFQR